MVENEQIKQLQEELDRLAHELRRQHDEMVRLRQQLNRLQAKPDEDTAPPRAAKPAYAIPAFTSSTLENLIGLRLIHLIGIVVLVIGLSLGVKYAIDKNLISEGLRIVLAYGAGLVLYGLSVQLKKNYPGFSAILFSGAMASLYFTTFGACVYYAFLSYTASFVIMVALTVFTTYEAIRYNRQEIALLGLVGAYGIPFLISPNRGHPELLFLYITIINLGIVFVCAKKPWVIVGRAAQAITWLIFIGWAAWQNDPGIKRFGLVFMFLFFALFSVNALAAKIFRGEALPLTSTYQQLTNNLAFYLAALFVFGYSFADSTVALISLLFAFFAAVQAAAFYFWNERLTAKLTGFYALALFVIFIGFQWKGITVTLLWLLTAVVLFSVGLKFKSVPARMAGITLMGVTLLKLVLLDSLTFSTLQKVIAYIVLGVLLLVVSFFYQKFREQLFDE